MKRRLTVIGLLSIAGIIYAVCCGPSASDYIVSGYANVCITCGWEGDGVVYLEKHAVWFLCPGGEMYGYKIIDATGNGYTGVASMGQAVYGYIALPDTLVASGITWQGYTSTRPSVIAYCSGTCGR